MADDKEMWSSPDGMVLWNVHPATACAGRGCPIHHPSQHRLVEWSLIWRDDAGKFERVCTHGVGHPDPDDLAYKLSIGIDQGIHGCDGCCQEART